MLRTLSKSAIKDISILSRRRIRVIPRITATSR
jgi:hypothetical protein